MSKDVQKAPFKKNKIVSWSKTMSPKMKNKMVMLEIKCL